MRFSAKETIILSIYGKSTQSSSKFKPTNK